MISSRALKIVNLATVTHEKVAEEQGLQNCETNNNNEYTKRQFVASRVEQIPIKRTRERNSERRSKRQFTNHYSFEVNGLKVVVCKNFFLNTLCISQQTVDTALLKKEGGLVTPNKRGKHTPSNKISEAVRNGVRSHISKFPTYESHYSRKKNQKEVLGDANVPNKNIAKKWLYSEIFNYEYNYSFKTPDSDTCDICDKYKIQLQESSIEERTTPQEDYERHLTDDKKVLMIDPQKCLPTPELHNSQSFYFLKFWTYNLTIHDSTAQKYFCMMWDESVAGRGGNEVASCLLKFVSSYVPETTEQLTIWSDNCPSQNRNVQMIMCYEWIFKLKQSLKVIIHKYLSREHTHLEVDGDHSVIERERKKIPQLRIITPWDWQQVVRLCSTKNPFTVVNIELEDFVDFKKLCEGPNAPFIMKKTSEDSEPFLISKIVHFEVRQDSPGMVFFKTAFDDNNFRKLDLNRRLRRSASTSILENLHQIRDSTRPISTKKYNHLQQLLPWVPNVFHHFYKNLPHGDGGEDSD
ncbi:hypothetical protein NQ314_001637 [Rhamnusium bicolor]|uniref:DUF7869 domain-containing protein n=1 Tax=Rhamnusium bicolor TaxID=1586634 RepID=A0AAV8ZSE2_9CUCU|nr:hypothetical protein NQ314_001637 [Rhamnusium bicolor]